MQIASPRALTAVCMRQISHLDPVTKRFMLLGVCLISANQCSIASAERAAPAPSTGADAVQRISAARAESQFAEPLSRWRLMVDLARALLSWCRDRCGGAQVSGERLVTRDNPT